MTTRAIYVTSDGRAVPANLAQTMQRAAGYYERRLSDATWHCYEIGWHRFESWCSAHGLDPKPPTDPRVVVCYVTALAERCKPSTVTIRMAAIRHKNVEAGYDSPTDHQLVRDVFCGIRRAAIENGYRPQQASALNRPLIDKIIDSCGDRLVELRDKALISVAYDTLARSTELVSINVGDLRFTDDGTGSVWIRSGKIDNTGKGANRFIAHDTCKHLRRWIDRSGLLCGPLFRSIAGSKHLRGRVRAPYVALIFKRRAAAAGVNLSNVSGHSTRVGAAQDLVAAELGIAEVMQAGGWKSAEMVARYTEKQQARRGAMAKLAAKQNRL